MSNKKITFNDEMRQSIMKGVNATVDAVAQTLGPAGRTVLIEEQYGNTTVTRDGVTVAKNIQFEDKLENMGAQLIKNIASQTDDSSGDGTTTSSILAQAVIEEGLKALSAGVNPIKLRNGMNQATADIVSKLKASSQEIEGKDQIAHVASISANNDETIGNLIADAIEKVGSDGVITLGDSKTMETHTEYVEGMSFDRGYISPYFCTDRDNLVVDYAEPVILVTNKKLSSTNEMLPLLEQVQKAGKQLLIIAPEIEGDLLTTLIVNTLRGILHVCAVKAPGMGDRQKDMLEDIAILTGAQLINNDLDMKIENVKLDMLGSADSIQVTKDDTTIVGGRGNTEDLEARIAQIRKNIEEATSDYEKEKMQERLARLAGGVAVINIGDVSEAAAKEKKYRVEDAVNATRAAIEEGIVPGGGVALAQVHRDLKGNLPQADADFLRGYNIVLNAITKPIKQIAENAGLPGEVVLMKCLDAEDGVGFNVLTGEWVNMIEAGVIDPVKVTRTALENAVSVASLVLISGSAITIIPDLPASSASAPMQASMM
jgi:chaperonin GroEL